METTQSVEKVDQFHQRTSSVFVGARMDGLLAPPCMP